MSEKTTRYLKKGLRVLLWIIGSIIGLFLLIVLLLHVPFVQDFAKEKAVAYLEGKIGTDVRLNRITVGLPKKIILEGFYFEDQEKDTLLAGNKLAADISLLKILDNHLEINSVDLNGVVAHVKRDRDSVFNFDYIIDAFASPPDPNKPSTPMRISLDKINLDNIRVRWNDQITRNDVRVNLTHFDTHFKKFDLDAMNFDIPRIRLDGLKVMLNQGIVEEIAQTSVEVVDTISKRPDFKIKLGTIALSRISLGYDNKGTRLNTGVTLGKLLMEFNEVDMNKQLIDLRKFDLQDIKGNLLVGKFDDKIKIPETDTTAIKETGWKVRLKETTVSGIVFKYDDENHARARSGVDYNHLDISHFDLKARNLIYGTDTIAGRVDRFAVREASGVDIQKLQTDFFYGNRGAYLNNLELRTPRTSLREKIAITYPSKEAISKKPGDIYIDADIRNSRIGFKDILLFAPNLRASDPFRSNPNAILNLNTRLSGRIDDIRFPQLQISGIGNTVLWASGRITGLPDVKRAYFDVTIDRLQTTRGDVAGLIPKGTIPKSISLPAQLSARGTFKGAIDNFNTNLNIGSSYGNARVKAKFDNRRKGSERYDADLAVQNFDLGSLIRNDSLGRVTMSAKVNGTGLNPQTATATVNANVASAQFNGYTYKNLALDGGIKNGNYQLDAGMADPNLDFTLAAEGGFDDKYPSVRMRLNVDIADLEKLNLHAGPMKIRGNIDADIPESNPDFLNGSISLHHVQFLADGDPVILDSVNIVATSTPEKNTMKIRSQVIKADIEGKYKLTQIADAISNSVAKYYDPNPQKARRRTDPQYFDFDLRVDNDPVIYQLMPKLTGLEPFQIKGRYNSEGDTIRMNGEIPRLVYAGNTISGATLKIDTKDNSLVYDFNVDGIQSGKFDLPFTSLVGNLKDDIANFNLVLRDDSKKDRYQITGLLETRNGQTELRINPDNLKLNYDSWTISPNNRLRFGEGGIIADNFELSHEGSAIRLQSLSESFDAPLKLEFADFNLETVMQMISRGDALAGGTLNGTAEVRNLASKPVFTADLDIEKLTVQKQPVGDLAIRADNFTDDLIRTDVQLSGEGNDMRIFGTYRISNQGFDLDLDMASLQMKSIQGFTFGQIKDGAGYLSGNFQVGGTVDEPRVVGDLNFNNVGLRVTQINSYFGGINERVAINAQGLNLDRFTIRDEKNNTLVVNGRVLTTNYRDFGFDMTVDAQNFRAVNSKAKDNDLYYGDLFLDADLDVGGTLDNPVVEGRIRINEDTNFSVVLPQSDPAIADREGIVEFVDEENQLLKETLILRNELDKTEVRGVDVSVHIEIVKEAMLSLVIDKGNGDYLNLKGEGDLTGGIDPSGKTTLTGKYEFTEGAYEMSFNLLRRRFEIKPGSYIIWNGEPTQATIDVTAIYKVDAAPIDLVGDQLAGVSQSVRNTYKQKIPFETLLKMNGELLRPIITFDIVLPDGNYAVSSEIVTSSQTKLEQMRRDPAEMNKQVFALLLLNRFIGENPFASEAGSTGAEAIARQSVSKILSQQLNNIAGDLIKGVELNFDLESTEDYTTGVRENRTDLNIGVSKKMLDDRLKITVGSSFGLEGQQNPNEQANTIAGDISADYQLTKDGRYMVRAYRKNEYQVALQGQVVETGLAFIITMDYNKFRELFHRTEEEKEMRRRERERRKQEREANVEPDNKPALNIDKDED